MMVDLYEVLFTFVLPFLSIVIITGVISSVIGEMILGAKRWYIKFKGIGKHF
jgi:hypothetical protein